MLAILWKDLLLEARSRDSLPALFVLGLAVLVVFDFSLALAPDEARRFAPGILWVALVFAAGIALGKTFLVERENGCLDGLLASPLDRGSLFLAKFLANTLLLVAFEALLVPATLLLYGLPLPGNLPALAAVLAGGAAGLAATGTLFALAAHGTRAREVVLPLLVLPLQLPLLVAGVQATSMVLAGSGLLDLGVRGTLVAGYDVLAITTGWLLFEYVLVD